MRLLTAHRPTKEKRTPNKNMKHKVCLKFYDKACKRFVIKIEDFDSEAFDHACCCFYCVKTKKAQDLVLCTMMRFADA